MSVAGGPVARHLAGVGPLLRVSLHQDARRVLPWVVLVSALAASSVLAYDWVFPDPQDRAVLARSMGANPALSLVLGPARDLTTADGFAAWRAGQLGAFFTGLMTILLVVRNSRAPEDTGRAELVASGVLARSARLAVAVLMAVLASVAVGVVCFAATVACGGDPVSTLVLSATFTASGLMFAGVAAVAAQLGSDARAASTLAVGVLGTCYVLRGYLDSSGAPGWVTWLTPLGWLARTRPASGNDPVPLLPALALAGVLVAVGFVLQSRRDFGQGLLVPRPGPAGARGPGRAGGLALRLHRGLLATWAVALTGLGLLLGTLVTALGDLVAENPTMAQVLAPGGGTSGSPAFGFLVTILDVAAVLAAVVGVQVALHLHAEEVEHRVEPLLATSLRRSSHLASYVVLALVSSATGLLLAGTALGLVAHGRDGAVAVGDVVAQAVVTVPAVWVLVALALAAVGAAPRRRVVGWLGVVATFVLTVLGPTLDLPDRVLDLSPLRHVPDVTAGSPAWGGPVGLLAATLGLLLVAFVGFRRRDVG